MTAAAPQIKTRTLAGWFGSNRGVVRVFSARTGQVLHQWENQPTVNWGRSLASRGVDLDGDGIGDVLVGQYGQSTGSPFGSMYVYSGRTGDLLQLCFWRITGGATGSFLHHHVDQEQLGIVVRGKLDFRIGEPDDDARTVLGPGEIYLAPRAVWHGDSAFVGDDELNEVWILDVFAPPREDLRNG